MWTIYETNGQRSALYLLAKKCLGIAWLVDPGLHVIADLYPQFRWQSQLMTFGLNSNIDLTVAKFRLFNRKFCWLRQLATESVKLAWP